LKEKMIKDSEMVKPGVPLNMDKSSRNYRLMEHLLALGLFVEPVYTIPGDGATGDRINYLVVSAGLPDKFQGQG